ncbi:MAG TPA: exo-beta-N-acetylmuramidase NamZ domain-containing protein, partial [Vicinamibacteria bacterium]|nr:exo-beta-N-acetylmuramidase NamZ domain-containing protein [Vicinamibacteria bacterium]
MRPLVRRAPVAVTASLLAFWSCGGDTMGPDQPGAAAAQARPAAAASPSPHPKPSATPAPLVKVGLDQIEADHGGILKGKKIGLIAHAASVTSDGRRSVDAMRVLGVEVVRMFAPEHGTQGKEGAGEPVADEVDPLARVPIVSLYGAKTKPAAEDLKGIDALVFDLQDGGVRFYTYMSTMILALQAASEAGIDFVVLDRPNPLGG